ncbi:VpaChn25_0724 family phage protein [Methylomonas fluvii]|uniref:ArsR family transcriptional regulator n=1 Tax=Methylomonas fluvii TaxID=1854564 RepID=A0ABR9DL36_9GAMM|nr:hypothetical protein [Methylomonas fluvii]MBD9362934.1 hypothetical protein [Methylomonas fluvii]
MNSPQSDEFNQKLNSFRESDIRYLILQILSQQPIYTANQELLLFALRELGNAISHEQIYIELIWLEKEAEVLSCKTFNQMHIAKLNVSGLDVANGTKVISGIRRPMPYEIVG